MPRGLDETSKRRLGHLFEMHQQQVLRACLAFSRGNRDWALDRLQEVFIRLAEKLGELEDLEDLGGWLYRVSVNVCLMQLRRERGLRKSLQALMEKEVARPKPASAERQTMVGRDLREVERALADLPPLQRTVMVLVYVEGREQAEVTSILGLSKGYVSKLHAKAVNRLRKRGWEITPD